jgi:hypothetical protein
MRPSTDPSPAVSAGAVNRPTLGPRTSVVATASDGRGRETQLAGAVHHVLATLTDLRTDTSVSELRDRIVLVQWLRGELAAVETLLTGAYGRRAGATAEASHGPDPAG